MGDVVRTVRRGRFIGWYVRYKDADGRRKQRASHQPTQALARRFLVEIEARVARGQLGIPEPAPPAPTLQTLIEQFLRDYSRPRIKDLAQYRCHARVALRRALPLLGHRRVDVLSAADVARLRDGLLARHAAGSVRQTLTYLATLFTWAVKCGVLIENPLRSVEKPTLDTLVEFLGKDEVCALLDEAARRDGMLHGLLHLALHSGLRKGELFGLRWSDVDLDARRLDVRRSYRSAPKNGKVRHLRLATACVPVLRRWKALCPRTAEGLVFPVTFAGRSRMGDADDMLGLPELLAATGCRVLQRPFHALRHTFASHFIMAGGNLLTLQKMLGHSDVKMTLIYAHLAPDFMGDEVDRIKF